jgi:hypothetical protein
MNIYQKILGAICLLLTIVTSMYFVLYTKYKLVGLLGMALILCLHLTYKYKFNWRKS